MFEAADVGAEALAEDLHVDLVGEALRERLGDLQQLQKLLAPVRTKLVGLHGV